MTDLIQGQSQPPISKRFIVEFIDCLSQFTTQIRILKMIYSGIYGLPISTHNANSH